MPKFIKIRNIEINEIIIRFHNTHIYIIIPQEVEQFTLKNELKQQERHFENLD